MKFSRLRLSGFKSFVETTELPIEQGLTGIVGPNGCGKSNLLEALRWVMGENSAKSMRGSGMDDVIFAGTNNRPSRNTAEVQLVIDNMQRSAPSAYNDGESIEISRRIEREMGSIYRINGRDVRARDVQIFFADVSSGAHSPALVKQGQIGQLINAKPIARRAILEEAAGISGLHARRHEAELKLNAAQTNLSRVADVIQEIETQLANLKRQARQASRYRNLSGHIQRAEALALFVRWQMASTATAAAEEELGRIRGQVEEATLKAAQASNAALEADEKLPPLRTAAAERSAALQRLTAERMALDGEETRAKEAADRLSARIAQIGEDHKRESARVDDARGMVAKLAEERGPLEIASAGEDDVKAQAAEALRVAEEAMREAERASDRATAELAEAKAKRAALERRAEDGKRAAGRLHSELQNIVAEIERLGREAATAPLVEEAAQRVQAAVASAEASKGTHAEAEEALRATRDTETTTKRAYEEAEREIERLRAEARALSEMLASLVSEGFTPVIDLVHVTPGFEGALGAALGEDLNVPLDGKAPIHWRSLGAPRTMPGLPEGAQALAHLVQAPEALARRLSQIGVVERAEGAELQTQLQPGQCLVSREGDLWRWDGFTVTAEAPTPAAVRLRQRNRLADLQGTIKASAEHVSELKSVYDEARAAREAAEASERAVRDQWRKAETEAGAARTAQADAEKQHAQTAARTQSLNERHQSLAADESEAQSLATQMAEELGALAALGEFETRLQSARESLNEARGVFSNAKARHDGVEREARARQQRLAAIANDHEAWESRIAAASGQIEALQAREAEARAELTTLEQIPAQIAEKRTKLFEVLAEAEEARKVATDSLALAENGLKAAQSAARMADHALANAREERARCEAVLASQQERLAESVTRARDTLDCAPEELAAKAEHQTGDALPALDAAEQRVEKLKREREQLGGVNLRADEEAEECETRLTNLQTEKGDLEEAINRLRHGIGSLNKEGRERLLEAFDRVNANFQKLFTSLFGGGEARLTLTESDDPLEAGLEILARPPGKKLQTMSLLSGGEQALTAMAMIFAVFLCNPAPVCVLDEVDAPLDDANVERFCNLLDEMTRMTETRFLVITHHALTMSRMDRLVGVTMQERGVSQLVAVDLAGAERVLAAAAAE